MDKKAQTKYLYSLAAVLGILEQGNPDDNFHALVYSMTGKQHVSELTASEGKAIEAVIKKQLNHQHPQEDLPGMMTEKQKNYAKGLMHQLVKFSPSPVPEKERLAGAVRKILGITAFPEDPLRWVRREHASKLITAPEHYVKSAKKKAQELKH